MCTLYINKKLKPGLILSIFTLVFNSTLYAQEHIEFGQYTLFQPIINNASAAKYSEPVLALYGRTQWTSIEGAPSKIGADFIFPFTSNSLGVTLKQESIGVHTRQLLLGNYTHKVAFGVESYMALGLGLGAELVNSKYSQAAPNDSRDLIFGNDKSTIGPEMNFGVYFYSKKAFAGFSIPSLIYNNIVEKNELLTGESQIATKHWHYFFTGGYSFTLSQKVDLDISGLMKIHQNTPVEFDFNALILYEEKFGIGASYRTKREVLFMANYDLAKRAKIGYSYHAYFGVNGHLLSGHELICLFTLVKRKEATLQTPRF